MKELQSGKVKVDNEPIFYNPKIKMKQMEVEWIKRAIIWHRGSLTSAAIALGMPRATLYRKIKEYNLQPIVHSSRTARREWNGEFV